MSSLIPMLLMALLVAAIAGSFILASSFLGPKKHSPIKDSPFECGIPSEGFTRRPVAVRFYLMALLFILFDVELTFLFPWAIVYRSLGMFGFIEMFIFFAVVAVGFIYAWKIGALEWE
jgi:NADH-quinone oxidoreductase subunit A